MRGSGAAGAAGTAQMFGHLTHHGQAPLSASGAQGPAGSAAAALPCQGGRLPAQGSRPGPRDQGPRPRLPQGRTPAQQQPDAAHPGLASGVSTARSPSQAHLLAGPVCRRPPFPRCEPEAEQQQQGRGRQRPAGLAAGQGHGGPPKPQGQPEPGQEIHTRALVAAHSRSPRRPARHPH